MDWFFAHGSSVASASAFIGAIILGYPIVLTAIKDLRSGVLSINELVAIAVLAAFASGDYRTAGVVAFFMLMGEIIETRTAEGARASIESLIKLTPTKARRLTAQGEEEVAAKDLAVGDVIRIRPGDNVAAERSKRDSRKENGCNGGGAIHGSPQNEALFCLKALRIGNEGNAS